MAKRLQDILIGLMIGVALPAGAAEVYTHCAPALRATHDECARKGMLSNPILKTKTTSPTGAIYRELFNRRHR